MLPPNLLALLIQAAAWSKEPACRDLLSVELFAGQMEITRAMLAKDASAVAYDKAYHPGEDLEDITTARGFARALGLVMRICPGGSLWAAPVCSSWGFIGRAQTQRSPFNPAGNRMNRKVKHANRMVVLTCMLMVLAWTREVHLWLEQPQTTIMHRFSPAAELVAHILKHKQSVFLSSYGQASTKPLVIWCSHCVVAKLKRQKPRSTSRKLYFKDKKGRTQGHAGALKESAAYPPQFGRAVAELFCSLLSETGKAKPVKKRKHFQ